MLDWIADMKAALESFRLAIGILKDLKGALPSAEASKAIDQALDQAERSAHVAETQMAKSLGYHLCQCTFPPQIMLSQGYDPAAPWPVEYFLCPKCRKETPPQTERRQPDLLEHATRQFFRPEKS